MFLTPTIEEMIAQEQQRLQQLHDEAWKPCGVGLVCSCAGNWLPVVYGPRLQYVSVPVPRDPLGYQNAPTPTPDQFGFGPGWLPYNVGGHPHQQTFIRYLNAAGGIDFACYPPYPILPIQVGMAWARYRFKGLGV